MYSKFLKMLATGKKVVVKNTVPAEVCFKLGGRRISLGTNQPMNVTDLAPPRVLQQATELHDLIKRGFVVVL